jgi:hypothetical protein
MSVKCVCVSKLVRRLPALLEIAVFAANTQTSHYGESANGVLTAGSHLIEDVSAFCRLESSEL